jgi:hypothetical protein
MCEAVGHPVRSLERVAFGPLTLGALAPGAHRRLSGAEVDAPSRPGSRTPGSPSYAGPGDPGPWQDWPAGDEPLDRELQLVARPGARKRGTALHARGDEVTPRPTSTAALWKAHGDDVELGHPRSAAGMTRAREVRGTGQQRGSADEMARPAMPGRGGDGAQGARRSASRAAAGCAGGDADRRGHSIAHSDRRRDAERREPPHGRARGHDEPRQPQGSDVAVRSSKPTPGEAQAGRSRQPEPLVADPVEAQRRRQRHEGGHRRHRRHREHACSHGTPAAAERAAEAVLR